MSKRSGGLVVGAQIPDTGIETLLEALTHFPGARVELIGGSDTEERRACMRRAAYLIVPGRHYEVPPREVVEAFANGLPVIASRAGALLDLVEHGRNGLFFEPGSARALARRLAWAEAFPEKMRQMGECAQADYRARLVAHWSWPRLYGERRREARAVT